MRGFLTKNSTDPCPVKASSTTSCAAGSLGDPALLAFGQDDSAPVNKALTGAASREFTGRLAGRPGPLEIITTEPAGHINTFADEIKAGHGFRRHTAGIEAGRVHAAECDFRRAITFRTGGLDLPILHLARQLCQSLVGHIRQMTGEAGLFDNVLGKTLRQDFRQGGLGRLAAVLLFRLLQQCGYIAMRLELQADHLTLAPVG